MMKRYQILYVLIVAAVLVCGLWGGGQIAPVLLALLLLLPAVCAARLYLTIKGISISLTGPHSCRSGQKLELTLKLVHPHSRPAGKVQIHMVCENLVFGTETESACFLELGKGKQHVYSLCADTAICGGRSIQIREMVFWDQLGLFSYRKPIKETVTCTVLPYEASMYVSLGRRREREQPGDLYDGKKSGTDVSEMFGLREYREGDPLQSIHWKLSGKMQQLIVREFGRPVNYHTLLLLAPAFCYGELEIAEPRVNAVFDLGVSLSHALLSQDIAHFVGGFSDGRFYCMPVDSLRSYEEMLLELMERPVQKNGEEALLAFIDQQLYRQYTKVVYVAGAVNEAAAQNLSVLADLTILQAMESGPGYLTDSESYGVVGIPVENIRSKEHIIPL